MQECDVFAKNLSSMLVAELCPADLDVLVARLDETMQPGYQGATVDPLELVASLWPDAPSKKLFPGIALDCKGLTEELIAYLTIHQTNEERRVIFERTGTDLPSIDA